jgi:hypothetical protein
MIKLSLQVTHKGQYGITYEQRFPDGYIHLFLDKRGRKRDCFNYCYVELGADEKDNKYRFYNSKSFYTEEAFIRAKTWINDILIKYEKAFIGE